MDQNPKRRPEQEEAEKSRALGIFLVFFGLVVLIAILFTPTAAGKLTNFIASLLLAGSGGLIAYLGQRKIKRSRQE